MKLTTKQFRAMPARLVSLNTLQPITFEGKMREVLRVKRNLTKDNTLLVFKIYTKVYSTDN
jgi:hypothetical protein